MLSEVDTDTGCHYDSSILRNHGGIKDDFHMVKGDSRHEIAFMSGWIGSHLGRHPLFRLSRQNEEVDADHPGLV